jgi:putative transposase
LTLKRLDLAFQAFFRRVKAGKTPGYPRFKSLKRFKGWGYKTHGDGWRLEAGEQMRHGCLRIQGVGKVRIRGGSRTPGEPKTCEVTHRHGKWYASITIACHPTRTPGEGMLAFDWGIETFATMAVNDEQQALLDNPRFLQQSEAALKAAYQDRDGKRQFSRAWRQANKKVARLHSKMARQRKDFHHKETAKMVAQAWVIATERLQVSNLVRRPHPKPSATDGQYLPNGAKAKAGLNKAILDGAPAQFLGMLRYKAAEAGAVYVEAPTRTLKPSQTCHQCGRRAKKRLQDRWHTCPCGASCHRDTNAMWVVYEWGQVHVLSVFLAWVWLANARSQELAARHVAQNLPLEPVA